MPNRERKQAEQWRSVAGELRRRYLEALLAGAQAAAEGVIREAIDTGTPEAVIDGEVIAPAMRVVGDLWERGKITVADEHLATQISMRVLALQREAFRAAGQRAGAPVLMLGIEGEQHILGLEMAASILTHAGYRVVMLGGDVPLSNLPAAIDRHRPVLVGLTATMPGTMSQLRAAIEGIRGHAPRTGVIAGGAGVPTSLGSVAGVAVCSHVGDAVELTDGLLHHSGLN
jgi:MerR family transcriptional regulator, light-induced transcriptional regulator